MNRWLLVGLLLTVPLDAAAQAGGPGARGPADGTSRFTFGLSLGAAGVDIQRARTSWEVGPLLGTEVNWLRPGSTISLGLELQPFEVPVSFVDESFRALYLFPSYELRGDRAALGLGIGLAAARLTGSPLGDRTEWGTVTGLSLSVALRADFSLEVGWRNTGDMGGFKSSIWLTRVAWTWDR